MSAASVSVVTLDLPPLAGGFARRLHDAGVPVTAERAAWFARALRDVRPVSRRRLYWTARAVFVTDPVQVRPFEAAFAEVFGRGGADTPAPDAAPADAQAREPGELAPAQAEVPAVPRPQTGAALESAAGDSARRRDDAPAEAEQPVPVLASDEELIRAKRFDAMQADELALMHRLMSRLVVATPQRRTRRAQRCRRGEAIDLRRTLRGSLRTAGDPVRLARRRRRVVRRRLVLLCDISGSMEPYARPYLQFLTCAAAAGADTEAFAFATRLTRLTRALHAGRNPDRAIQRAAQTAPDWSSGTRIGEALKAFNDRHGRRGMARGAVVVILSDGWERGDPEMLAREMARLRRLAHRIVWVNPRVAAAGFTPRTGGMAAALPFCDALVSGHSLEAMGEVVAAIGGEDGGSASVTAPALALAPDPEPESWPSATPVAGSSVAMPSGYGPSRGRTTPGWS